MVVPFEIQLIIFIFCEQVCSSQNFKFIDCLISNWSDLQVHLDIPLESYSSLVLVSAAENFVMDNSCGQRCCVKQKVLIVYKFLVS